MSDKVGEEFTRYHPDGYGGPTEWDAIIVGSGVSGLGAAAILSKEGKRVLVVEKHKVPGGLTHTFRMKGLEFDIGVHYVGRMSRRLLEWTTDGKLEWSPKIDEYDRAVVGDRILRFRAGEEHFRSELLKFFPEEEKALDKFLKDMKSISGSVRNYMLWKTLPSWMRFLTKPFLASTFLANASKTVEEAVESTSPDFLSALSYIHGVYGLPPNRASLAMHALAVHHYINGARFPAGGPGELSKHMLPVVNGSVLVYAPVKSIVVENGRAVGVEMERGGRVFRAPIIISSVGVLNTYHKLIPQSLVTDKEKEELGKLKPSVGHSYLFLGFNGTAEELGIENEFHNIWVYGREGDPYDSAFICFPCVKDCKWKENYPGRSNAIVIAETSVTMFKEWENTSKGRRGDGYMALKKKLADSMFKILFKYYPQLEGKVQFENVATPLTTAHYTSAFNGASYGLEHTSLHFTSPLVNPQHPSISGLYLTGQDMCTCGFVPSLISSAMCVASTYPFPLSVWKLETLKSISLE